MEPKMLGGERVMDAMDLGQFVEREGIDATAIGNELPNKILVYAKASGLCGIYVPEKKAVLTTEGRTEDEAM